MDIWKPISELRRAAVGGTAHPLPPLPPIHPLLVERLLGFFPIVPHGGMTHREIDQMIGWTRLMQFLQQQYDEQQRSQPI